MRTITLFFIVTILGTLLAAACGDGSTKGAQSDDGTNVTDAGTTHTDGADARDTTPRSRDGGTTIVLNDPRRDAGPHNLTDRTDASGGPDHAMRDAGFRRDAGSPDRIPPPQRDGGATHVPDAGHQPTCHPTAEICDGLDNDCDDQTDEGCTCIPDERRACRWSPSGECANGATESCVGLHPNENHWDDSCYTIVHPTTEICNGLDDDCDGRADENFRGSNYHLGEVCTVGNGICERQGTRVCTPNHTSTMCDSEPGTPQTEIPCNGLDDDCDGSTAPYSRACYSGPIGTRRRGICHDGAELCAATGIGWSGICQGDLTPQSETCNTLDDDCDGSTDEDFRPPAGNLNTACTVGTGICQRSGRSVCRPDYTGTECNVSPGTAEIEVCANTLDDDCDGETDELSWRSFVDDFESVPTDNQWSSSGSSEYSTRHAHAGMRSQHQWVRCVGSYPRSTVAITMPRCMTSVTAHAWVYVTAQNTFGDHFSILPDSFMVSVSLNSWRSNQSHRFAWDGSRLTYGPEVGAYEARRENTISLGVWHEVIVVYNGTTHRTTLSMDGSELLAADETNTPNRFEVELGIEMNCFIGNEPRIDAYLDDVTITAE